MEVSFIDAVIRLGVALALGAIIGLERELSQHPAGLRTHILVCMGAAVFTILSVSGLTGGLEASSIPSDIDYRMVRDPARIAAQIVTGIGFIGGGAVLRHGATVRGLTTAASLWMIASIGMLAGSGHFVISLIATLLSLLVLSILGRVGRHLSKKHQRPYNRLRMLVTANRLHISELEQWIQHHYQERILEVKSVSGQNETTTLTYVIDTSGIKVDLNDTASHINAMTGINSTGLRLYYHSLDDE